MPQQINTKNTAEGTLMTDFGENFQYVKTILTNSAEIKKLELIQYISKLVVNSIKLIAVLFFSTLIFLLSLVLLIVLIANALNSIVLALLIMIGVLLILILMIYPLLKSVVKSKIESSLLQHINL